MQPRSVRNKNPGNVRLRAHSPWPGQTGVDDNPGGPFAIFSKASDGFDAMGTVLISYGARGIRTVQGIISVYAPPGDNNDPGAYAASVAAHMNVKMTASLDLHDLHVLEGLATAIAHVEAGPGTWWEGVDQTTGLQAALARLAKPVAPPPVPDTHLTAAQLTARATQPKGTTNA